MARYTHSSKIGNQGDVPKHVLLPRLVHHLCSRANSDTFIYTETHSGRPVYALGQKGEWEEGVGDFYNRLKVLDGILERFPNLGPYLEICLNSPPCPGSEYPGSSGLVFHTLKRLNRRYRFFLCDADSAVCADLMSFFPQWDQVTVWRGNGFDLVPILEDASLVLVDPAYMDTKDDKEAVLKAVSALRARNIPFVCWTPRFDRESPSDEEAMYSTYEREVLSRGFKAIPIKWREPKETDFWGCFLVVSDDLEDIAKRTTHELLDIMEWTSE